MIGKFIEHSRLATVRTEVSVAPRFVFAVIATCAVYCVHPDQTDAGAGLRTTARGVFSADQSARGQAAYLKNCSNGCHMPDLSGSERAPQLAGSVFIQHWRGTTLQDLFTRIQVTMPQTSPHSLDD